ncbi:hypothetical protein B6I21_00100 [candidate division KSB1 bacterium 4572_119]|nr:MAG: hypothetical protein B6I21_00100 [candidate division KSB1 bacterium 4572_119]
MKVQLGKLREGVNELIIESALSEMGLGVDENTLRLFPNKINARVEIQKLSDKYFVRTSVNTLAHFTCDRCLEDYDRELENTFQLYFTNKSGEDETSRDDFRFLAANTDEIDLAEDVVENLQLTLPMKNICKSNCKGLCPNCGANLNINQCNCRAEKVDPRWEELRKLTSNKE